MNSPLPRTPKDLFRFPLWESLLYNGLILFFKSTGLWQYPRPASGDIETMTFLDKVYWLYKTVHPMRHARRHSHIETYFAHRQRPEWRVPNGFLSEVEVTLAAAGDLIHHPYLLNSAETIYGEVLPVLFGADISMANLECPIIADAHNAFEFSSKTAPLLYYNPAAFAVVKGYKEHQFSFLATACNHSLDFGVGGIASTVTTLKRLGIAQNGLNLSEEAAVRATVIERRGVRIGVIAHTFGLNGMHPPAGHPHAVNRTNLNSPLPHVDFTQIDAQIADCKTRALDFIVAHLHWGLEHEFYPTPDQVAVAHRLAEAGIDAIVGHHSHVIQPIEYYRTKRDPDRVVPIYYSLGNLINYFSAPYLCQSAVAQMTLVKGTRSDGSSGVYVKEAGAIEVCQHADSVSKTIQLKLA